jgi:hypothetical protein
MLKEGGAKASVAELVEKYGGGGRGGLGKGPGKTEMTFGEKSSEEGVGFKGNILPPASQKALREGGVAEVGARAPEVGKPSAGAAQTGALGGAAAGGGSANTGVVLPRHRGTVGRYFERPARPAK